MALITTATTEKCYHCGENCTDNKISHQEKVFCCQGCLAVHELLEESGFADEKIRKSLGSAPAEQYVYLDHKEVQEPLLDFTSDDRHKISIHLPDIHCSSCVYLLERLHRLHQGIHRVSVHFTKKEADILYDPKKIRLSELASLLDAIGYPPQIDIQKKKVKSGYDVTLKMGIAGFCFGNIMLLSFPEYLGMEGGEDAELQSLFVLLSMLLSWPVFFYAGNTYLISAWKGLKSGHVNIDVPIALGLITLFVRSHYEVLSQVGAGYFDSLAGLVFFLLIGRWFQGKTYENLNFERDYKSYFPLAVLRQEPSGLVSVPIQNLEIGDEIIVRNQEIIPADGILLSDRSQIDYSFVTGEDKAVAVGQREKVFAGGKQVGGRIRLRVTKQSSQSYLTDLWNNQVFKQERQSHIQSLTDQVSRYFTPTILLLAVMAAAYWYWRDISRMWEVFTAVLIVACPCALALAAPFTHGNATRIMGKLGFYLKKASIIELISSVNVLVFDKTGTITHVGESDMEYIGEPLDGHELAVLRQLAANSTHPVSQQLYQHIKTQEDISLQDFKEYPGKGLEAQVHGVLFQLGSASWLQVEREERPVSSRVYVCIDRQVRGYFNSHNKYREGLDTMMRQLSERFALKILSGDNAAEKEHLVQRLPSGIEMFFDQKPEDKLQFIKGLQKEGCRVMMLGDGLNDAGALRQSDVGIAVTENTSSFSPACDAILEAASLQRLATYLKFGRVAHRIIIASFIISFLYNLVGFAFAVSGLLTPVLAAILMPLSSISIVVFTTLASNYSAKGMGLEAPPSENM